MATPPMAEYTLSKTNKLANSHEYQYVFDDVLAKGANRYLLLLARPCKTENASSAARLGLIAPKKKMRFAPDRNRFKRLVREYFRHHKSELQGLDIIALATRDITKEPKSKQNDIVKQAFDRLLTNCPNTAIISTASDSDQAKS